MPILDRGNCKSSQGFALIELLLVLVLIGIALKMVLPNLAQSNHSALLEEGERLTQLMNYVRTQSITTGKTLAWDAWLNGYRFLEFEPRTDTWLPILDDRILKTRTLPEGITVAYISSQNPMANPIIFRATSVHSPFEIVLKNQQEEIRIKGNLIGYVKLYNSVP